jgi:hypothetical protein
MANYSRPLALSYKGFEVVNHSTSWGRYGLQGHVPPTEFRIYMRTAAEALQIQDEIANLFMASGVDTNQCSFSIQTPADIFPCLVIKTVGEQSLGVEQTIRTLNHHLFVSPKSKRTSKPIFTYG